MHPFTPNPLRIASQAERLAGQDSGAWGLVFQGITAVSLAVVTSKMLLEMLRSHEPTTRKQAAAAAVDDDPGPAVRREVERAVECALAARGRGG